MPDQLQGFKFGYQKSLSCDTVIVTNENNCDDRNDNIVDSKYSVFVTSDFLLDVHRHILLGILSGLLVQFESVASI